MSNGHALGNPHNNAVTLTCQLPESDTFTCLWSSMPLSLKQETRESHFENLLMQWIQEKIPAIP